MGKARLVRVLRVSSLATSRIGTTHYALLALAVLFGVALFYGAPDPRLLLGAILVLGVVKLVAVARRARRAVAQIQVKCFACAEADPPSAKPCAQCGRATLLGDE